MEGIHQAHLDGTVYNPRRGDYSTPMSWTKAAAIWNVSSDCERLRPTASRKVRAIQSLKQMRVAKSGCSVDDDHCVGCGYESAFPQLGSGSDRGGSLRAD